MPSHRITPALVAIPFICATSMMATTTMAQGQQNTPPAQAAQSDIRQYNIPAGPLSSALTRFATEAGIFLVGASELAQGKTSPGLQDRLGVQAALDRLLVGTGLQARPNAQGQYVLEKAVGVTTLPAVQVSAMRLGATTEGTESYTTGITNTATKLNLSPRETPQTISVITRQQMDDFAMTSVDDALKATSGVFVLDRGNNGSAYYSRGFALQSQYDGIPNPIGISQNNINPQIDNAFLDRVEVLQGPSGLMSGAGDPGGTINLVRKRPTREFQAHIEAQGGSWNQRRVVGDISGPLVDSGRIRGRMVALVDKRDSFVDYAFRDRQAFYGVLEADITSSTMLYASLQYQKDKGRNHFGVPFAADGSDAGLDRSDFFGNANQLTTRDYTLYTVGLEQQLPADWTMKLQYSGSKTNISIDNYSYLSGNLNPTTGNGLSINQMAHFSGDVPYDSFDAYVSGPVTLLGREHELVFGANGSTMTRNFAGTGYMPALPINVFSFNPTTLPTAVTGTNPYIGGYKITQRGVYGVGRFNLTDSLKLITGVRVSSYEDKDVITGATTAKESNVVSPYAGLIYDINKTHSAYVSYSDIFNPQSEQNADGDTLKPIVGSNYEVGLKSEFFGGELNTAVALFRLEQTNLAQLDESVPNDPANICGGQCYTASDKVTSQGVELSINGEIVPGWNLTAGYTYVDSQYASGADNGEPYATELPKHTVQLYTTYKLPKTNWTIGGDVRYYSKIYREGPGWTLNRDALVLVGLTAKYQINPNADLTLVVNNVFDKTYRAALDTRNYSTFGQPRNFVANLQYRF